MTRNNVTVNTNGAVLLDKTLKRNKRHTVKAKMAVILPAFIIAAVLLVLYIGAAGKGNESNPELNSRGMENVPAEITKAADVEFATVPSNNDVLFIMGEYGGKVAVLSPDREVVYQILDVFIDTLPETDRKLLRGGINIFNAEQLRSLLEDYES